MISQSTKYAELVEKITQIIDIDTSELEIRITLIFNKEKANLSDFI